jgi:prevent-host-death family protein
MKTIDIQEVKTRLSQLIDEAANGEPFLIAKEGKPLVIVTALDGAPAVKPVRRLGFLSGENTVPDDFDGMGSKEILDSFEE